MSDSMVTLEDLKQRVKKFCDDRDWDQFHTPKELALGLITEAAELVEHFRFQSDADVSAMMKSEEHRDAIGQELSDCLFFILRFAEHNGFDLDECLRKKMEISARRYPLETAKGSNKKYRSLLKKSE